MTLSSGATWISLNGNAEMVNDNAKARELWNTVVEAWMPQGPDDPSVVLIKVDAAHRRVLGHSRRPDRLGGQLREGQGHR